LVLPRPVFDKQEPVAWNSANVIGTFASGDASHGARVDRARSIFDWLSIHGISTEDAI
jgi:hypothetical protein